jgi:hypothetical protein
MKLKLLLFSLPNCHKCKYYIEHPQKFDDLAKCEKFKVIYPNNITMYEFAEYCRKNENKCGISGKEYIKLNN